MSVRVIEAREVAHSMANLALHADMMANRAEIFGDVLKWVDPDDERDGDVFDRDGKPVYLIAVDDETGDYRGSLRLLPTTGLNMLRDVFSFVLPFGEVVESATIWESSRICAIREDREGNPIALRTIKELVAAIGEMSVKHGWTQIVTVVNAHMVKTLKACGLEQSVIGSAKDPEGKNMIYALLIESGVAAYVERLYEATGVDGPVIERAAA